MLHSFDPIETAESRILILGTMPGRRSLEMDQYYAFAQNVFWPIMRDLFGWPDDLPYSDRCGRLRHSRVALWDVLHSCSRPGSLDSNIRAESIEPNDFATFFESHRKIRAVFFNGGAAEKFFRQKVFGDLPEWIAQLHFERLPSTSPANARQTKGEKRAAWRVILDYC
jgi:double-stranded uracil-DNA glycosylase